MHRAVVFISALVVTLIGLGLLAVHSFSPYDAVVAEQVLEKTSQVSSFPPSFLGHPWAYSAALFSQLTVFAFAMGVIFYELAHIDLKRDSCVSRSRDGKLERKWSSPVNVYRVSMILFMTAISVSSGSNLLVYLAWNEVSPATMETLFAVEKVSKAVVCIPFLTAVYLWSKNDEVLTLQLSTVPVPAPEPIWPTADLVRQHVWTVMWIFTLAVGVTLAKWGDTVAP